MAGDTYYNQDFIFSDGTIVKQYIWFSDVEKGNKDKFPKKGGEVAELYYKERFESNYPTIVTKMSQGEIRQDRLKRSRNHFKQEVWPTMSKEDQSLYKDRKDLKPTH